MKSQYRFICAWFALFISPTSFAFWEKPNEARRGFANQDSSQCLQKVEFDTQFRYDRNSRPSQVPFLIARITTAAHCNDSQDERLEKFKNEIKENGLHSTATESQKGSDVIFQVWIPLREWEKSTQIIDLLDRLEPFQPAEIAESMKKDAKYATERFAIDNDHELACKLNSHLRFMPAWSEGVLDSFVNSETTNQLRFFSITPPSPFRNEFSIRIGTQFGDGHAERLKEFLVSQGLPNEIFETRDNDPILIAKIGLNQLHMIRRIIESLNHYERISPDSAYRKMLERSEALILQYQPIEPVTPAAEGVTEADVSDEEPAWLATARAIAPILWSGIE